MYLEQNYKGKQLFIYSKNIETVNIRFISQLLNKKQTDDVCCILYEEILLRTLGISYVAYVMLTIVLLSV